MSAAAAVSSDRAAMAERFAAEGFLLLRGLIPAELVQGMRRVYERATERILAELVREGLVSDTRPDLQVETRLAVAAGPHMARYGRGGWQHDIAGAELFALFHCPALLSVLEGLMGREILGHHVFNARPKLPHQQLTVVPWHQDSAYFGPESAASLIPAVWIPVVPATRANGCMEVSRGTHRAPLVAHREESAEGRFLEIVGREPDPASIVTCEMQPGDALILHNRCWHRSLANVSDGIRWSVDIRYHRPGEPAGDSYLPAPWVIRSDTAAVISEQEWRGWCRKLWG